MIRFPFVISLAIILTILGFVAARADDGVPVLGYSTTAPYGEHGFCQAYPGECQGALAIRLDLTAAQLRRVVRINRDVNHAIASMTDQEHWGTFERWNLAEDGVGDCEDYALVKRKRLREMGFPQGAMLLTTVLHPNGSAHMVLTLATTYGDLILDNLTDRVLFWRETPYEFRGRQDPEHPGRWFRLEGQGEGSAS